MGSKRLGPAVAGSWYPAQRGALERQIDEMLAASGEAAGDAAATGEIGRVIALIAPHAGYVYSGNVAGQGFRLVRNGSFARVILLGPSHYGAFQGASLPEAESYYTPLGEVPIDVAAVARLRGLEGIQIDDRPFQPEHCLEMEIPFLQRTLIPGWRMLPVLIGGGSTEESCARVADALLPLVDPETLLVVSTDFTHYGSRFSFLPFEEDVPERIRQLDMGAVERILASDRRGFAEYVGQTGATICGRCAIDVLLSLLPGNLDATLVAYDTSGRLTGEWDHSVSYASLIFHTHN